MAQSVRLSAAKVRQVLCGGKGGGKGQSKTGKGSGAVHEHLPRLKYAAQITVWPQALSSRWHGPDRRQNIPPVFAA